jgi:hypothetical protein
MEPGKETRSSSLIVAKDHVIDTQCEWIIMDRMDSPLGVKNGLVEPNLQAHPPEGFYINRPLVQVRQEVPDRTMNTTIRDQNLTWVNPLAYCDPVKMVIPPGGGHRRPKT